jgi:type 1 fimbriae regulatory protein FimB/type 1 fimbriae regulatory protein FimE
MTDGNVLVVSRAGELAQLPFPVHPHMLRHARASTSLRTTVTTRAIQQYLGHKNITHTVRYTELAPQRFNAFWKD